MPFIDIGADISGASRHFVNFHKVFIVGFDFPFSIFVIVSELSPDNSDNFSTLIFLLCLNCLIYSPILLTILLFELIVIIPVILIFG